jgi:hypothetical protein
MLMPQNFAASLIVELNPPILGQTQVANVVPSPRILPWDGKPRVKGCLPKVPLQEFGHASESLFSSRLEVLLRKGGVFCRPQWPETTVSTWLLCRYTTQIAIPLSTWKKFDDHGSLNRGYSENTSAWNHGHGPDMARHKRSWLIPMVSSHGIFRITLIKEPMIIELVPGTNRVCWVHPLTIIDVGWNLNLWWF